jgi:hypothetical protein
VAVCVGVETDHSPPSSVEVKNVETITALTPYVSIAWCLIKVRYSLALLRPYCTRCYVIDLNGSGGVISELELLWKEASVAIFEVIFRHFPPETVEYHENPQSR